MLRRLILLVLIAIIMIAEPRRSRTNVNTKSKGIASPTHAKAE